MRCRQNLPKQQDLGGASASAANLALPLPADLQFAINHSSGVAADHKSLLLQHHQQQPKPPENLHDDSNSRSYTPLSSSSAAASATGDRDTPKLDGAAVSAHQQPQYPATYLHHQQQQPQQQQQQQQPQSAMDLHMRGNKAAAIPDDCSSDAGSERSVTPGSFHPHPAHSGGGGGHIVPPHYAMMMAQHLSHLSPADIRDWYSGNQTGQQHNSGGGNNT